MIYLSGEKRSLHFSYLDQKNRLNPTMDLEML